ncbi:hypothetical protein C1J00_09565 [Streptomyces cahuitamycinicus]|uniref:Uncharacterized protein n=2 Tax=Streptomyces cahuitamycinicus TaxID=2070367 RepID=A0A2N8TTU6_9ACTN|nr:hypothetical protein C1J00_09565 [Streptomyces cahuitamycinicus]
MAALRAWAEPGLRARLIKAAWDAGNQNINELTEAARVDRKTVYADLAAEGIDPKTDRTQGGTPVIESITVSGMFGDERDNDRLSMAEVARLRDAQDLTLEQAQWVFTERLNAHEAAAWHNKVAPMASVVIDRNREAERALRKWDTAWEALSSAKLSEWAAAHHRFIIAWDEAREALNRQTAAWERLMKEGGKLSKDARRIYEEAVSDHKRIDVYDQGDTPGAFAEGMEAQHQHRARLAAQTLRALSGASEG